MAERIAMDEFVDKSDGIETDIKIELFKPVQRSEYEYRCQVCITRGESVTELPVIGESSFQSLSLAIAWVMQVLQKRCQDGNLFLPEDPDNPISSFKDIYGLDSGK